jgi:hypothetical protein
VADSEPNQELIEPGGDSTSFLQALYSGGDGRIAADPHTGLNKYLCPRVPAPDLVCASSCTASPISARGFDRAAKAFFDIAGASSPRQRAHRLATLTEQIKSRLLHYFDVAGLARVTLCPSGTDAMLTTAMLIAAERPGEAMTAILPSASETGTGVPMAALCRVFDGPDSGKLLTGCQANLVEIPLRSADGSPRSEDDVSDAFAAAAASVRGHAIVYLTYGTKTGLVAPASPPRGADVIVDACQARIEPETVATYLRRGWPVVVTGSKFLGGPAFSGAILFPVGRRKRLAFPHDTVDLGTVLRWTAAMAVIDAFGPSPDEMSAFLTKRAATIKNAVKANPALMLVGGLRPQNSGWADLPSIFTVALHDPSHRGRLLSMAELRPAYERLASLKILLGQPVNLGRFGGLRIATGARDLLDDPGDGGLARIFAALLEITQPQRRPDGDR